MTFQVLVSTLNCPNPRKLVESMHIDSDAIIINQCNKEKNEKFAHNKHTIEVWYVKDRGIGKSRNMALEKSTADIILFADDDEILLPNYQKKLTAAFKKNKKMDFAICNIKIVDSDDRLSAEYSQKSKKIHRWNCFKYGACRFAIKKSFLERTSINFDARFGASIYAHGEDSVFIQDCLSNHAKIFITPETIATCSRKKSTWFDGFNKKYYYDTGAIFARSFGRKAVIILIPFLIKKRTNKDNIRAAISGLKDFNKKDSRCTCS